MPTAPQDDLVAVHRAFAAGGREAAMTELRRRWWRVSDATASDALDRVLALPMPVAAHSTSRPKPHQPT